MSITTTTAPAAYAPTHRSLAHPQRSLRKATSFTSAFSSATSASSPSLNSLYNAHSRLTPSHQTLPRKSSLAALTSNSLASIPDVSESYAYNSVLAESPDRKMVPTTPGKPGNDFDIGDVVEVPGNMLGTVRFIGTVQGKKGTFAGVELHPEFSQRGKNSGEVEGVSYFTTTLPGAGIFLPATKAVRRDSPPGSSSSSFPHTPTASTMGGLKVGSQNSTNFTPPTPSLPTFSKSVGPGRSASPGLKKPSKPSLRPESPIRKLQMTPGPRPSLATPNRVPSKYTSPTGNRFAQSVRGTAGDPSKTPRLDRKPSVGPRSASALGQTSLFDDESTPTALHRTKTNGSVTSVSSYSSQFRVPSRAGSRAASRANNDHEMERLRTQLEDRERQLRDQAATLAEMESSLTELQTLMENSDMTAFKRNSLDDKDSAQLRLLIREKNDKIAMLTAEFDAHRADFRSTIDTLEMASTETERVYEKRIDELMQEIRDLESRTDDVDVVARQLKQLEELVQELEEGLEDARRGEAEARGEVEFLRGEVERTRTELRREREKASAAANDSGGLSNGDRPSGSKELEQKEDEIRGLKAIIHSLSRDSVPDAGADKAEDPSIRENALARERLERELTELRALVKDKNHREEELEREVEMLRRGSATTQQSSSFTNGSAQRSSLRDSRDTVILMRNSETRSPEATHKRGRTLDTMPESDTYSSVTENSTLWCEICETGGHDILTCTNMFGTDGGKTNGDGSKSSKDIASEALKPMNDEDKPPPLSPMKPKPSAAPPATLPAAPPIVKILPNPMENGPVAGKDSGVVDSSKWCALCERDGHDSVDCPFEDAF
ncbi:cap-gly domain containing protein [Colletotrichum truncatum]|uniref:Cap-gly domain containing protein n=1 Tax=Colletotrichum truncatum TaxID=5467 RepID=A0ACC3Z4C1_COLTU|nr:cap-gly domain containing protein [Colletotrichum truncatum]KAF6795806.1 cap-gly domain containing protein [Colletotrichum truncatum]